ncbi:MAG: hypothetical protein A2X49_05555 [Lentisphaerae bacterium GWF2_52_8]|nr:MAG: hypothetical protein A2X49_05555 [Lentisphaerae bacterium GWF2_52_8]
MAENRKLRAAVIGLGVGEKHIEGYLSHPACEVAAICDINAEKLRSVSGKYPGLRTYTNDMELLAADDIDLVSIASFDNCHHAEILAAVKSGKHVFVEKPLCLFPEEAAEIRAALNARPEVKMSSNLILRMSPRFQKVREMAVSGELGEVYYLEGAYDYGRLEKLAQGWRGELPYYSVMLGGGVHMIDLMLWMRPEDPLEEVIAFGNRIASKGTRFRFDDLVAALFKFRSGLVARLTCNFGCVRPHFHELAVYGTKASFVNSPGPGLLYTSREEDSAPQEMKEAYREAHKGDLIRSFVDAILGKSQSKVTVEDVFAGMSACFAVEEALKTGRPVKVKYL